MADPFWDLAMAPASAQEDVSSDTEYASSVYNCREVEIHGLRLCIRELLSEDGVMGEVGGELWSCSFVLALLLLQTEGLLSGSLCEVGAGCGLTGLVIARSGSALHITDAIPHLLENLEETIVLNEARYGQFAARPVVAALDWEDYAKASADRPAPPLGPFDVIFGSELVYTANQLCLADVFAQMLKPKTSIEDLAGELRPPCGVVLQRRDRIGWADFVERCETLGLRCTTTPVAELALDISSCQDQCELLLDDMVLCVIEKPQIST